MKLSSYSQKPVAKTTTSPGMQSLIHLTNLQRYVLDLDTFNRAQIEEVLNIAEGMKEVLSRDIKQVPALRGKTIITLFYEKSDATRVAFELAAKALSATLVGIAEPSVPPQGHSLGDIARKVQGLGASIVVMRHPHAGIPYQMLDYISGSLINAGDGYHADPAEALTDLFTIRTHLERIEKHKIVLLGDILSSGAARSCLWGLAKMGARVTLCAPPTLLGPRSFWQKTWPDIRITYNLDDAIEDAHAIKVVPIAPSCFHTGRLPSLREFREGYALTPERMQRARKQALVLSSDAQEEDFLSPATFKARQPAIEQYVTNSIAVRMALLYMVSGSAA
jgi:aspartate carbamoyltransferase catalytic subunit